MKIIKPNAEYMEHDCTPYQFIEKIGRVCYKSEDKITEDSAEKFVEGLVNRGHLAMMEHETIYLQVSDGFLFGLVGDLDSTDTDLLKYLNVSYVTGLYNVISGSFRSFMDLLTNAKTLGVKSIYLNHMEYVLNKRHGLVFKDFKFSNYEENTNLDYSCRVMGRDVFSYLYRKKPEVLFKHLTHTIKFTCDRGVTHEFVRHRPCSFAQESTRYCNYSNDKFGNEITVIEPLFFEEDSEKYLDWKRLISLAEAHYFELLELGATPQEARSVLPNSLKTELVITATEKEWSHIVDLRFRGTTGSPHPQMKEVMSIAIKDLVEKSEGRIVE